MSRPFSRDFPLQSSMILSHFVVPDERSACQSLEPQLTTRKRKMCSPPAYADLSDANHWIGWASLALTRYLDDGAVPINKNQVENQKRPWALGRSNWLFAGWLRSGKRAAAIMSLIQSARMNGHDPYAYLKDVLTQCRHSGPVRSGNCCRINGYRPDLRMVSWPDAYRQALLSPNRRAPVIGTSRFAHEKDRPSVFSCTSPSVTQPCSTAPWGGTVVVN